MKILFVSPFFAPVIGGVESVLETTCIGLAARGHSVFVLTGSVRGSTHHEIRDGFTVIRSDLLKVPDRGILSGDAFDYQTVSKMFSSLVQEIDPAIIHFHNYQMRPYSMFLNCFLGSVDLARHATLNTMHNDSDDSFSHYVLAYAPLDRVVTVTSRASVDLFEGGVPSKKLVTVPNMIDVSLYRTATGHSVRRAIGLSKHDPVVLFPSRLIGREGNFIIDSKTGKGLNVLIKALPEIVEAVPNVKLMLLGNDPVFANEIKDFKRKFRGIVDSIKEDSLVFLDQAIPNSYLPELFAASDVVVSLSPREAFGMVFLEAMAAGKPVVGVNTCSGGVPEVVPDEIAGYLVPENDPHATAKAINRILGDDDIRKYFQRSGLNWVMRKFDVNVVIQELLNLYNSVLLEKQLNVEKTPENIALPITESAKSAFSESTLDQSDLK